MSEPFEEMPALDTPALDTRGIDTNVVYGRVDSEPKSRRWHLTSVEEELCTHLIGETIPRTISLRLERLCCEGVLDHVPHGYGCISFWTLSA